MSVGLSIAAGLVDGYESVLTIAATITAIGYSSVSTWLNQIVQQAEQEQAAEFNNNTSGFQPKDVDLESDLESD